MFWLGLLLFLFLNGTAFYAGLSVAVRLRYESVAETTVVAIVGWMTVVTAPILALGWTGHLDARSLALAVLAMSAVATTVSYARVKPRVHTQIIGRKARDAVLLPIRALQITASDRSVAAFGVAASLLIILYTAWLSYLAPSSGWDGIWYHETIVGYAIQNHGFRLVDIPETLQYVNGFPRVCEAMNLWFVIFTDRRLIEAVNSVMSIPLMLTMYLLARRYSPDRSLAMGWAAALFLMPGLVLELRSTYIDLHIFAIFLMAIHFATRPNLRIRDGWVAAVAIALLSGTKGLALIWVPALLAVLVLRAALRDFRTRPWSVIGLTVGAVVLAVGVAGPTYIRNWVAYHNPVWPVRVDVPRWNIHWMGSQDVTDMNKPVGQLLDDMLTLPLPGHDWADTRTHGYGMGLPFVVLPLTFIALLAAIVSAVVGVVRSRRNEATENILWVSIPMLLTAKFSPALWSARYNVHVATVAMLLAHWLLGARSWRRANDGVVATVILTSLMMLWWADPRWTVSFSEALTLMGQSAEERATYWSAQYMMDKVTATARERELGPKSVTAYTDLYLFPSLFWNDHFTNKIVYVHGHGDAFLHDLDDVGAAWAIVGLPSVDGAALQARPSEWELIGSASTTAPLIAAFRRKHP